MSGGHEHEEVLAATATAAPDAATTTFADSAAVSAPPVLSPLDVTTSLATPMTHAPPPEEPEPTPLSPSPAASKRRAASFQDRLPLRTPRSAVASAFASVSSATTTRFAKFRSLSSETFKTTTSATPPPSLPATGSWKANVHGFARRARDAAKRAKSGARPHTWERPPPFVTRTFEYHSEDAGAASSYFHVVSDGVSSPFARTSLAQLALEPVSSALLARALVRAVAQALQDVTSDNAVSLDAPMFESVVVDAIRATRIQCFRHRQSRLAATLTVAYFDRWHGRVLTFALGDSKCVVVRGDAIVFESTAVVRDFNMPTVVSLASQVTRTDYVVESFALQARDVCLTFSDGVGDNLYKDDIELAVQAARLQRSDSDSDSTDDSDKNNTDALQMLCDELVLQSQMKISVERAQELMATADAERQRPETDSDDSSDTRISVHDTPVRGLFPFATAAAREYRARALEELSAVRDDSTNDDKAAATVDDHLVSSLALVEKHKSKRTLDRQQLVRRPTSRSKRHYNLLQLQRMAEMPTKKPDDITLFITQFS